jgi:hypothetical protein
MTKITLRRRFYAELVLTIVAASLAVLTLVWPDWIEGLTGFDPDAHNGSVEWLVVGGLLMVTVVSAAFARREYLRVRVHAV